MRQRSSPSWRDTLAATVLGLFTTSWLTIGLTLIVGPPGARSIAVGFYLFAFTAAVIALTAVSVSGKPLIALTLLLSAARATLDGLYEVSGSAGFQVASGYVALAVAATAGYAGTALLAPAAASDAGLRVGECPCEDRGVGVAAR